MIIFGGIFVLLLFAQNLTYAQVESGNFDFEGNNRNYKVFLPDNYSDASKFPLVFNFHPYGFDAQWQITYTRLQVFADTLGYIIVYPNAVENWNSGISDHSSYPTPDVDDVGFINALIDTLNNHYSIDLERIYACGFSNGGFMSLRLACELSHRIAAIASVGGSLPISIANNCDPTRTVPVLMVNGTDDLSLPIGGNSDWYSVDQTVNLWIGHNNCLETSSVFIDDLDPADGCTVEKISYTDCDYNCNVLYYKVHGGGHTWPGGNTEKWISGNTNMDVNANYEILKFFNEAQLTPASVESHKIDVQLNTYPNPFDTETTISFQLLKASKVEIRIYNAAGQEIKTFLFQNKNASTHTVYWDGTNNYGEYGSGGLYMISLSTSDFHTTKKVIFIR